MQSQSLWQSSEINRGFLTFTIQNTVFLRFTVDKSNAIWDKIALEQPLVHKQSQIRIHLVGIHHISALSVLRVKNAFTKLKPIAVCVELDHHRVFINKQLADLLYDDKHGLKKSKRFLTSQIKC